MDKVKIGYIIMVDSRIFTAIFSLTVNDVYGRLNVHNGIM